MLEYLLKSGACMAVFLLFYKLLLEKERMHVFKRFYLLGAVVASFVIPSIVFVAYVEPTILPNAVVPSFNGVNPETIYEQPTDMDVINWPMLLWMTYGIGLLAFGYRFVKHLFQILNRIKTNPKFKQHFSIKVLLQEKLPPHTFFSYIFLNKNKFESNTIPKEVLLHEETHARQCHSIDVIFIEFLQVILWFNPLLYLFKKSIKLNHEFLADSAVLAKEANTAEYQNTLLSYLSQDSLNKYRSIGMANAINYSSIKKRFTVMKKRTSKKSIVLRSFLLLPLIAVLLLGFSERKLIEREKADRTIHEIAIPIETIEIRIDSEGKLFLQNDELVALQDLEIYLLDLNGDLSKEERKKSLKVLIHVVSNTPKNIIKEVDQILMQHGVAQINIIGPESPSSGNQIETVTEQSEIKKYNTLAKKYNAMPIAKRKIPLKELKVLETIYKQMTETQRKEAQPFPECLPKNTQEGASRKQMAEYNKLAKHYNNMSKNKMRILKSDVERLEYIFSLMSDKQKADAEPFPDFPEPPPAPKAPEALNEREEALNTINKIIEEQDGYDNGPLLKNTPIGVHAPINTYIKKEPNSTPAPPTPPAPISPLDHAIEMAKQGATFYYKGKKVTSDEAIKILKENQDLSMDIKKTNDRPPVVKIDTHF